MYHMYKRETIDTSTL